MSIATTGGDGGETSLIGGRRVSKAHPRVNAYGTVDELISSLGFARAIAADVAIAEATKRVQRELFGVGSALASEKSGDEGAPTVTQDHIDALTADVHALEASPGILGDWALPGEHAAAAAYDVARTICRRAEREVVALRAGGADITPLVVVYLNRLSDLLWLYGRKLENDAGVDGRLREKGGPEWSRAW